jgi:hypothetical protein
MSGFFLVREKCFALRTGLWRQSFDHCISAYSNDVGQWASVIQKVQKRDSVSENASIFENFTYTPTKDSKVNFCSYESISNKR